MGLNVTLNTSVRQNKYGKIAFKSSDIVKKSDSVQGLEAQLSQLQQSLTNGTLGDEERKRAEAIIARSLLLVKRANENPADFEDAKFKSCVQLITDKFDDIIGSKVYVAKNTIFDEVITRNNLQARVFELITTPTVKGISFLDMLVQKPFSPDGEFNQKIEMIFSKMKEFDKNSVFKAIVHSRLLLKFPACEPPKDFVEFQVKDGAGDDEKYRRFVANFFSTRIHPSLTSEQNIKYADHNGNNIFMQCLRSPNYYLTLEGLKALNTMLSIVDTKTSGFSVSKKDSSNKTEERKVERMNQMAINILKSTNNAGENVLEMALKRNVNDNSDYKEQLKSLMISYTTYDVNGELKDQLYTPKNLALLSNKNQISLLTFFVKKTIEDGVFMKLFVPVSFSPLRFFKDTNDYSIIQAIQKEVTNPDNQLADRIKLLAFAEKERLINEQMAQSIREELEILEQTAEIQKLLGSGSSDQEKPVTQTTGNTSVAPKMSIGMALNHINSYLEQDSWITSPVDNSYLKQVWRELSAVFHPDNQATGNEKIFKQLAEAHEVLVEAYGEPN